MPANRSIANCVRERKLPRNICRKADATFGVVNVRAQRLRSLLFDRIRDLREEYRYLRVRALRLILFEDASDDLSLIVTWILPHDRNNFPRSRAQRRPLFDLALIPEKSRA